MKTVIRYQSQLLPLRSYKPGRKLRVTFRPSPRGIVPVADLAKMRIALPTIEPARASPN